MTPFKELAERIEAKLDDSWYCCVGLYQEECKQFFKDFFQPTTEEYIEYDMVGYSWMSRRNSSLGDVKDNTDRITALLFADQLWQDEENRKYDRI